MLSGAYDGGSSVRLPASGLPAQSFRLPLKEIVSKCRSTGFTGALAFAAGDLKGAVLFRTGVPICAEMGGFVGQQALSEIEGTTTVVRADLHLFPAHDIDTLTLFNERLKVEESKGDLQGKTTIKAVRIGHNARKATIRVIKVDEADRKNEAPAQNNSGHEAGKKQILNPSSIEILKKMSENFENDASDLLREMQMEHLISRERKGGT